MATIDIFSKIAKQTAKLLDYEYLEDVDKNITMFIKKLLKKINLGIDK